MRRVGWSAVALALVVGTWNAMPASGAGPSEKDLEASSRVLETTGDLRDPLPAGGGVRASGTLEPRTAPIELAAEIGGVVGEVPVETGEHVTAGTVVLRLRSSVAEARVSQMRAALDKLAAGATAQDVDAARGERDAALARSERSRHQRELTQELLSGAAATDDQLASARSQEAADRGTADAAEARLANLLRGSRREDVRAAQASLDEALASLALGEVRAPVDGEVLRVDVVPGEYAAPGQALVVMGDTSILRARLEVDERDLTGVTLGTRGTVHALGQTVGFEVVEVGRQMGDGTPSDEPGARQDSSVLPVWGQLDRAVGWPIGLRVDASFAVPIAASPQG